MTRYLLDTNIVSGLLRAPRGGRVREHINQVGEEQVCTSIIVAAELRFGVERRGSARLAEQVDAVLGGIQVIPFEAPANSVYGAIRASLERRGQPIGAYDLLIAAHALALDCTMVTDNQREFCRIPGLRLENWLRA